MPHKKPPDEPTVGDGRSEVLNHRISDGECPSEAIVAALAATAGESPTEMRPLGETIDLESIDALVTSAPDSAVVIFAVRDYHVKVTADVVVVSE